MEEEFKAMKAIVDTVTKNWEKLGPDSRAWVKARLDALPVNKSKKKDSEEERT